MSTNLVSTFSKLNCEGIETQKTQESKNLLENSRNSIYQKCLECNKKVMLHWKCKCSNYYCPKHLHQHECSFSHFMNNKTKLEKLSVKIEPDKLIRI